MKKTISVILLLALCLSLFAGCKSEAPAELTNLERAKALVFNAYKPAKKDEVPVKTADFEVMTGVLVDGQMYPVSWAVEITAGPTDAVKIVDGSSDAFKKVDVTEKPEEEVNFTLTATLSDGNGNTATVSFKFKTPKAEAPTAGKVVIKLVKDGNYVTGTEYEYTSSSSGKKKMELVLSTTKADAVAFNMIENDDGSVTFKTDDGYFLFCDASNVMFVKEQDDNTKFVLETADADGGYFIKCAVANYGGKAQYLEVYSGYLTCYGMGSDPSIYIFELEDAAGAAGKVNVLGDSSNDTPAETDPPVDNSNDPPADSTLSIVDAIALGASKAHDTYTAGKYYVTGEITEVYNEQYGNMKIKDASGNILTIYGTYDATGNTRYDAMATKPVAGDTVTIYGIIGQYKDTPQIKNGWITSHTPAAGGNTTPPATNPPAVTTGASVTFDFSSLGEKSNTAVDADTALAILNAACANSGLKSVSATKVYKGNDNENGAFPYATNCLKLGSSKEAAQLVMTFDKKVAKVEITCHDWYTKSDQYPNNSNTVAVNGSEAVLAPYTADATAGVLTFNLDGSSDTVTIDTNKRIFVFKITVYFVG